MDLFPLNDDILEAIVALISPSDASQLAKACRRGYAIAMPRVLSEIDFKQISMRRARHIKQFCEYVLADVPHRALCLRVLKLSVEALLDDDTVCAMAEVLIHAVRLRELHLINNRPLDLLPPLADAITRMTSLEVIHMVAREESVRLLAKTASRPWSVELVAAGATAEQQLKLFRDLSLPPHLSASLRRISLQRCVMVAENLGALGVTFPLVHEISLGGVLSRSLALARVFPNVRVVHQQGASSEFNSAVAWPELDHIQVHRWTAIRILCPVRRIDWQIGSGTHSALLELIRFLIASMPRVLVCTLGAPPMQWTNHWVQMEYGSSKLKYLHMEIPSLGEAVIHSYIKVLAKAVLIGLSLGCTSEDPPFEDEHSVSSLAETIALRIPALQYVGLGMKRSTALHYDEPECIAWYEVVSRSSTDNVQMQRLAHWEGKRIQRQLLDST